MDFTILAVVLLIGVGIPARNKWIRKFRDKKRQKKTTAVPCDEYGKSKPEPLPSRLLLCTPQVEKHVLFHEGQELFSPQISPDFVCIAAVF